MTYRRKDPFYRRARAAGYRARSAYKLIELDRRYKLLRPGDFVVDLGAWPGGWLQVALERIGPSGRAIGVDLSPVAPLDAPNVVLVTGDIGDPIVGQQVVDLLGRRADVVLCDVAPKLTGVRATDEARGEALADATFALLPTILRPGGRLLVKLFMSPGYKSTVARLASAFADVKTTRPEATRRGSAELYAVGSGFRERSS